MTYKIDFENQILVIFDNSRSSEHKFNQKNNQLAQILGKNLHLVGSATVCAKSEVMLSCLKQKNSIFQNLAYRPTVYKTGTAVPFFISRLKQSEKSLKSRIIFFGIHLELEKKKCRRAYMVFCYRNCSDLL